ncbi:hypothetical protein OC709_02235 ['Planchonia careya' phytoplasma]|nr:hypothetical protein ['Planchonia careya' phytoplasma]MDO8030317.1 hypothetical protein ['Planchonia careya' phytoplasma]
MNYILKILICLFVFVSGILFSITRVEISYNLVFSSSSFFFGILFTTLIFYLYREYKIRTLKLYYSYYTKLIINIGCSKCLFISFCFRIC